MTLGYQMQFIECPNVSALAWDGDELVEPCTGRRFGPNQPPSQQAFFTGYPFDRGFCVRGRDDLWTVAYENRGTKAVLYRNWKQHRELNRSYYFAKDFDYPIALAAAISGGRVVIIHCPNSYDTVEIEDAETGEFLEKKKPVAAGSGTPLEVHGCVHSVRYTARMAHIRKKSDSHLVPR